MAGRFVDGFFFVVLSTGFKNGLHVAIVALASATSGTAIFAVLVAIGMQVNNADSVVLWICWILPVLILIGACCAIWKRVPYVIALPALSLSVAFIGYMRSDDKSPPRMTETGDLIGAESEALAAYNRLPRRESTGGSRPTSAASDLPPFPDAVTEWAEFVANNRALLEKAWTNDREQQTILEAMGLRRPEGVYPPSRLTDPVLDFRSLRRSLSIRCGMAHLSVIDKKPDDAVRLVVPLLYENYHLQVICTGSIEQMIANLSLKAVYRHIDFILERYELSAATRGELLIALKSATPIRRIFDNTLQGEILLGREALDSINKNESVLKALLSDEKRSRFAGSRSSLPLQSPILKYLLLNPNRTRREHVEFMQESWDCLNDRRLDDLDKKMEVFTRSGSLLCIKNPIGKLMIRLALIDIHKMGRSWWGVEDMRIALIKRIEK